MMEISSPSHLPGAATNFLHGFSPSADSQRGVDRRSQGVNTTQPSEIVELGGDKVYVAIGKSVEEGVALLQWAFSMFADQEICILHVHQPSPKIPTLLGKLPANQANVLVLSAFRNQEWKETGKLLQKYISICCRAKIKASFITVEADQIQRGIIDLISRHCIRKLVIGGAPDCMKAKRSSRKASYAAKNAPCFCELWFVNKGILVWTRQSSDNSSIAASVSPAEPPFWKKLKSRSLKSNKGEVMFHPVSLRSRSFRILFHSEMERWVQDQRGAGESPAEQVVGDGPIIQHFPSVNSPTSFDFTHECASSVEKTVSSDCSMKVEEESLSNQLADIIVEAEGSQNEVAYELLKCKKMESEATQALKKVKTFESAHPEEIKLRKDAEDALDSIIQQQEKIIDEREEMTLKLQKAMHNIALLDIRAQEANRRCQEVAAELKLIHATITTLRKEKQRIHRQKAKAERWIDQWKSRGQVSGKQANRSIIGLSTELLEFSISDLQIASCNFSESFRIGHGGYGAVYKGELLDITVAIKQMHPHNVQRLPDFYQQVEVLSKVNHPHLVRLIGISPEACSLVYEYVPGGSLQDHLFHRRCGDSLNWKTRARIISEIASALFFLHTHPEKIVHGGLKLENVLLTSDNSCKISDLGIYRLVPEQTLHCSAFQRYSEPKGAFSYIDPELQRTGILTPKADIYSFGLIILQLLSRRTPARLAYEVRKAVASRKFASILDPSAGEWSTFVARKLAELGLQCCELNSRDRPDLTPVLLKQLDCLHVLEDRPVPSSFLCPILQEIMHDPQIAADGFTYEGEALRGWLENGHDTSPMTNLKLTHLDLTPNHALRLAIQDWLCKS